MAESLLDKHDVASLGQQLMGQAVPEAVWCDSLLDTCLLLPLIKPSAMVPGQISQHGDALRIGDTDSQSCLCICAFPKCVPKFLNENCENLIGNLAPYQERTSLIWMSRKAHCFDLIVDHTRTWVCGHY